MLDRLYARGDLVETTRDYYAQDGSGNVWYFGEDTAELDHRGNMVSTDGTWRAGRDGAGPGIFMTAHPAKGDSGRQENLEGRAEDHFEVINTRAEVDVPYRSFGRVLQHKYFAEGLGTVKEVTVEGGNERNVLVAVRG
ncbi:hypothetical protein [Streptomyces sp. TR06-5]|uniref:hypothetical protein n=1 Tax=Streptomyces sp. TR06-5 TaxID=3385976 RepID=UPI0039A3498D